MYTSQPAEKLLFAVNVTTEPLPEMLVMVANTPWLR
jgi:hypothetical protein